MVPCPLVGQRLGLCDLLCGHLRFQPIESLLTVAIAASSRQRQPLVSLHKILRDSLAVPVKRTQVVLGLYESLFRCLPVPKEGIVETLRQAGSGLIQNRQVTFRLCVTVRGGKLHPFRTLGGVLRNTVAREIRTCEVVLCLKYTFFSSHRIEFQRLCVILGDPCPAPVEISQI